VESGAERAESLGERFLSNCGQEGDSDSLGANYSL